MALFFSFMRTPSFARVLFLTGLIVFTGVGCRGGGERPTSTVGDASATTTEPTPPEGMSCNHEYYPLRNGYGVQYHTTYPSGGASSGEGYYAILVDNVTAGTARIISTHQRPGSDPISSQVEYKCVGGGLYAQGYGNTGSLAPGGAEQNRFEVRTLNADGEFLPKHIDVGSHWSSHFDIKIIPLAARDVDGRPTVPLAMSVTLDRTAMRLERVRVPAGEYEAMRISSKTSFDGVPSFTGTEWWVKGVGMVKSTYGAGATPEENIVTEATRVTIPR